MKIAVIGRTRMLYDAIDCLKQEKHDIVLIGTCKAAPEYDVKEENFLEKAEKMKVPFFCNGNLNNPSIIELLKESQAKIAVSVNWPTVIGDDVLNIFPYGILNAHCGDLPRYKGNACPNWAILKGEKEFAISIHFMAPALDSGDIVVKKYYSIDENMNITDIYRIAERDIPRLFCEAVRKIQRGDKGLPQSKNFEDMLRCYPRIPTDSIIDWNWSCEEIIRVVKASASPFEGAYTFWGNTKIHIHDCTKRAYDMPCYVYPGQVIKVDNQNAQVEIAASDGIIVISKITIDGREYEANKVLSSARIRLNYCLQEEIYKLHMKIERLEEKIREKSI